MKKILSLCFLCGLLLFPAPSLAGAKSGLLLWFQVVLPTLAPFLIATQAVTAYGAVELLMHPCYPLLKKLFRVSISGGYILLCGMLCGYPLGGKLCAEFQKRGEITDDEANYLFAICNHPSPMFLLGFVRNELPVSVSPLFLLLGLYLPLLPISVLARYFYKEKKVPTKKEDQKWKKEETVTTLEEILNTTSETMVLIGGYLMLFSILSVWIRAMTALPKPLQTGFTALAEMTTGVVALCQMIPSIRVVPLVLATISFGGLSGVFQVKSVIKNARLSIRHYVLWKLLYAMCSYVIVILLLAFLPQ